MRPFDFQGLHKRAAFQYRRTRPFDFSFGNRDNAASPSISAFINCYRRIYFYPSSSPVH
jgi:hypothetical protein